ncbi:MULTISPECIES: hypothetical protein [unclassified Methylobacterium]|jgi:hypothetical protein|uniref:hypothetical protein n=1 Tax=unclassified Methylobacterium TaxID=2615210 RepID=UPI0005BA8AFF|nr:MULTISPECIES: hypothetical protein [unclassified Methylobacterium]SFU97816.1 hypothetical protein SAMN02799643_03623 [Methylobacterium sp. UNCCL125]
MAKADLDDHTGVVRRDTPHGKFRVSASSGNTILVEPERRSAPAPRDISWAAGSAEASEGVAGDRRRSPAPQPDHTEYTVLRRDHGERDVEVAGKPAHASGDATSDRMMALAASYARGIVECMA